jgi:hypothetical protein
MKPLSATNRRHSATEAAAAASSSPAGRGPLGRPGPDLGRGAAGLGGRLPLGGQLPVGLGPPPGQQPGRVEGGAGADPQQLGEVGRPPGGQRRPVQPATVAAYRSTAAAARSATSAPARAATSVR